MPRELPGLYWDEDKNRYFPLSSKPKTPSDGALQLQLPQSGRAVRSMPSRFVPEGHATKRRRVGVEGIWSASESLRASSRSLCRSKALHDIMAANIASTSRGSSYRVAEGKDNHVSSFDTHYGEGIYGPTFTHLVGDSKGWLHNLACTDEMSIHKRELFLASSISAVCRSGTRSVVTSFGTPCKVVMQDHPDDVWKIFSLPDKVCFDVWTAHLLGNCTLALGAGGRGIYQADMDAGGFEVLDTHSDVLAIHQQPNLVYSGARSGAVHRFDVRLDTRKGQSLLNGRFERTTSSVTHLSIIHEWELLVSTIRGNLETHDLRFLRSDTPVLHFPGHVNSYTIKLGIAVDPLQDFLYAGGSDNRIRAWSLRTGGPIPFSPSSSAEPPTETWSIDSPFWNKFEAAVVAMQVTESEQGTCLWASSAGKLHRWELGEQTWKRRRR
ncbi:hypothetical protein B0H21DRAFT_206171 [Amylocystis lapponica]|nr:hypothetical protein B0H21DRAFT_206171 [Amylocystis lapponica]